MCRWQKVQKRFQVPRFIVSANRKPIFSVKLKTASSSPVGVSAGADFFSMRFWIFGELIWSFIGSTNMLIKKSVSWKFILSRWVKVVRYFTSFRVQTLVCSLPFPPRFAGGKHTLKRELWTSGKMPRNFCRPAYLIKRANIFGRLELLTRRCSSFFTFAFDLFTFYFCLI